MGLEGLTSEEGFLATGDRLSLKAPLGGFDPISHLTLR